MLNFTPNGLKAYNTKTQYKYTIKLKAKEKATANKHQ